MSISSIMKSNVAIKLKEFGFALEKNKGSVRWVFSRKKEEITQYIVFQKSNLSQSVKVEFSTSNYKGTLNLCDMMSGMNY